MYNALLLSAALLVGQTPEPPIQPVSVQVMPPLVARGEIVQTSGTSAGPACGPNCGSPIRNCFGGGCGHGCRDCNITCLRPWKCEDLEMKCAEHKPCCGSFCQRLLWCGNGHDCNGDKKCEEKKEEEKKNGCAEECDDDLNPLMQAIKCRFPALFDSLECHNTKIYGWIQFGYTTNFDSPNDRLNYGTNFNNRSNDVTWNQFPYLVLEKTLDLDKRKNEFHVGYRVDALWGHDAPYWGNFALGLFDNYSANRLGAPSTHETSIDLPQFYLDMHLPILTDRGVDIRVGRFFTLLAGELSPAVQTNFYSHSYEYFYAVPFTHTGLMATVHIGDTLDVHNCLVRGWEVVFQDINDVWAYMGGVVWNSCDKRQNVTVGWITSPEQINNNDNWRTNITAYYTRKFGSRDQWLMQTGGNVAWEANAAANGQDAEWYGYYGYLFYTINPKLILGARGEWFRDDDATRTGYLNVPAFAGNLYEITVGFTYKPYQNLRIRPEIRWDWASHTGGVNPYNDQLDRSQTTVGIDLIWEF